MPTDPDSSKHYAFVALGFAMVAAIITLGQRLGEWRSKTAGRILGAVGALLSIGWIYIAFLWIFQIDLRRAIVENPGTSCFVALGAGSTIGVVVVVRRRWLHQGTAEVSKCSLLLVNFDPDYGNWIGDPLSPVAIQPVFVNAHHSPIGIRSATWKPHSGNASAKITVLQNRDESDVFGWSPLEGNGSLLVPIKGVFRARIGVDTADLSELEKLHEANLLGTITLTIDNREVTFNL